MVVDADGVACPCGRRGCWERYASGSGLGRMAREAAEAGRGSRMVELAGGDAEHVRGEHATAAALEGDPEALVVMRRLAGWVGLGLASLVHILDVKRIVIGGGLVEAGETCSNPSGRPSSSDSWPTTTGRRSTSSPPSWASRPARSGPRCWPGSLTPRAPVTTLAGEGHRGSGTLGGMEFRRITSLPPYVLGVIDGLKKEARRAGEDVIDLGFGNPDLPSPDIAVDKLVEAVHNPRNHRYSLSRGIPKLREAVGRPLPPQVRRRARPRDRGHQHHRGQGGLQPPDVGAARPGRRRPRALAVVPDPHLGPALRRRRRAGDRRSANTDGDFFDDPGRALRVLVAQAPGHRAVVPAQPHHHLRRPRLHAEGRRLRPRARGRGRPRLRLRRPRLRRLRAAVDPAGRGGQGGAPSSSTR